MQCKFIVRVFRSVRSISVVRLTKFKDDDAESTSSPTEVTLRNWCIGVELTRTKHGTTANDLVGAVPPLAGRTQLVFVRVLTDARDLFPRLERPHGNLILSKRTLFEL